MATKTAAPQKIAKKCPSCQHSMLPSQVEHPYWHDDMLVALIQNVPCWVCQLCGHRYFDPIVEHNLQNLAKDYIKLGKTFPIPSTSYRQAN